jgi:hypothetical protein
MTGKMPLRIAGYSVILDLIIRYTTGISRTSRSQKN